MGRAGLTLTITLTPIPPLGARGVGRAGDGGEDGAPGAVYLLDVQGERTDLPGKGRDVVPAGSRLILQTPGGGGVGNAQDRASDLIQYDLDHGLVYEARAESDTMSLND